MALKASVISLGKSNHMKPDVNGVEKYRHLAENSSKQLRTTEQFNTRPFANGKMEFTRLSSVYPVTV